MRTAMIFSFSSISNRVSFFKRCSGKPFILLLTVVLLAFHAQAQPCLIPIIGNSIDIEAATCTNTVATLKGTTPIGGTGVYTYQWERSAGNCNNANFLPIAGATARDYAVPAGTSVNDCFRRVVTSGSCTSTSNSTRVPNGDRSNPQPPTASVTASGCAAGTGTITITNPSPSAGITYSIDDVTYTNVTGLFTGLVPGSYNVTAKYPAGCVSPVRVVTVAASPVPTGTITPATATFCAGGSRVLTVNGGTSYQWYKDGVALAGATSSTYPATASGTYRADIFVGICKGTSSNSAVVTATPLPTGTITPASGSVCPGGSLLLAVNGNSGSSYQWLKDGQPIAAATSSTYQAVAAGTYTVTITSGGCSNQATNSVVVTQSVAPSGFITPASATLCPGGTIALTAVTAGGNNTFQWIRNGQFLNGANSAVLNISQAGTYNVIIGNGTCSANSTNIVIIADAQPITFTPNAVQPTCTTATGSITIAGVSGGGSSNYSYSSNNGSTYQGNNAFTNLAPGSFQLVVRDTAGCVSSPRTVVINAFVSTLTATPTVGNITCTQGSGSVTLTTTGGTSPYQYSLDGGNFGTSNTFQNLVIGAHTAVVKDAAGCTRTVNFTVNQTGTNLQATATKSDARCGLQNGSVTLQPTGGTGPYTYSLNGGSFQASATFNNLGAGNYKTTVKDAAGCVYDVFFSLAQVGTAPLVTTVNPPVICPLETVDLQAATITAGSDAGLVFTYWRDTLATQAFTTPSAAPPGKYFIKGTNSFGCSTIKPVVVGKYNFAAGRITYTGPSNPCIGDVMLLTATAGSAYQWYRNDTLIAGATAINYTVTQPGTYSVTISNDTCAVPASNRLTFRLTDCNVPDVFVPTGFTPNNNATNDLLRPILYKIDTIRFFRVYNRWGQLVFQTSEKGKGWDGMIKGVRQPSETYSWAVECIDIFGNTIKKSGKSLLIR